MMWSIHFAFFSSLLKSVVDIIPVFVDWLINQNRLNTGPASVDSKHATKPFHYKISRISVIKKIA
jgi:hypothetical protein